MAVLTKIPDAPVVYDDLRDTLNANGGSTNNEHKSYFVAATKVNWGARWKPVPFPKDVVSDADQHWQGKINGDDYNTGRCGVEYPTYTSTASLVGVSNPASLWKHKFPAGGAAQPYRISDFRKYNPKAANILASVTRTPPSGGIIIIGGGANSMIVATFNDNRNTDALDYTEIGYRRSYGQMLNNFYFGYIVIRSDGSAHGAVSMDYTMNELGGINDGDYYTQNDHYAFLKIPTSIFNKDGLYDVYPCLFLYKQSAVKSSGAIGISNGYIPLPCAPIRVETTYAGNLFTLSNLSASAPASGGAFTVKFRFTNKYDVPITISPSNPSSRFKVRAGRYTGNISSATPNYAEEFINATYTCPANSSIDISYHTSINVDKGQLLDLQVFYYYGTSATVQVSNAIVNPF
jgi:hypothetical protein